MRKIVALLILVVMMFTAAVAFAGEGSSASSEKNGWQSVYDSIASWSWSSGSSTKSK